MRLFIAVNFNEQVKRDIKNIVERVKRYAKQGRFVNEEHMHLTLEFLGEITEERVKDILSAMKLVNAAPFTLALSDLGYFKRREGNIYWFGITENKDLMVMQREVHKLLKERGFNLEEREYRPHITIGRKVKLTNTFNSDELKESIGKIQIRVNSIDLVKSERINGKLIYTTIFSKAL
ncbi:RNA 2',3'-cyclic phosphodiesterase [Desulfofalx alkaliphila]|uniref:RNA 2',3'-cyclic phosphodiesterase n=1 Tax=Desulfofalx alkaliphila TaxID=105483 RepID=UPI0004E24C0E|nr:RNA 2',3'-cyclic phosphodiesterase [Desulfofalx alkaliphila]